MRLEAGARLGPYEILGKLGAGGMGEVWRARDPKLARDVAIKVLPEALSTDSEFLARFEREAKLLAALNHPGIATLHDLDEADGVRFLVMELVKGKTLAERLGTGVLPIMETFALFEQIAEALGSAHENGVVHRDLKPSNIMVTPGRKVKLLDFGLAKTLERGPGSESETRQRDRTATGVILGTAPYMSPEQARG